MYEEEKRRIFGAVEDKILSIEHIGSTAVPGLEAKPIIDMMAGVRGSVDADNCVPELRDIGYDDITPQPGNPEWFYCLGRGHHSPGYHLHLVKFMSDHWVRHLMFRDILRTHPEVARRYGELKRKLASELSSDRTAYTDAKTSFIQSVIDTKFV
jgi:GrpB-like predicted nucleotidyltransferase (UPF0157 family)